MHCTLFYAFLFFPSLDCGDFLFICRQKHNPGVVCVWILTPNKTILFHILRVIEYEMHTIIICLLHTSLHIRTQPHHTHPRVVWQGTCSGYSGPHHIIKSYPFDVQYFALMYRVRIAIRQDRSCRII